MGEAKRRRLSDIIEGQRERKRPWKSRRSRGLLVPTVHADGTPGAELLAKAIKAETAVDDAMAALRETAPQACDYPPDGGLDSHNALSELTDRMHRLVSVRKELQIIRAGIEAQLEIEEPVAAE